MKKIKLSKYIFNKESLKYIFKKTPYDDIIDYKVVRIFYIGTIYADDPEQISEFSELAQNGDIEKMIKYNSLEENTIYAVLVGTKIEKKYLLALIFQYDWNTGCFMGNTVDVEIEEDIETFKNTLPPISLWYAFKEVVKNWFFLGKKSKEKKQDFREFISQKNPVETQRLPSIEIEKSKVPSAGLQSNERT